MESGPHTLSSVVRPSIVILFVCKRERVANIYKVEHHFPPSLPPMPPSSLEAPHVVMPPLLLLLLLLLILPLSFPVAWAQVGNTGPTGPYYNNAYSPSFAIIIVILVAALFLTGVFSIYLRHCGRSSASASASLPNLTTRHPRGLDASIIQSFPTLDYSAVKIHKIGKGALECAICLNEFHHSDSLRLIPKCDHVFHPDCIDQWLSSHTTCPVCRADLTAAVPETPTHIPEPPAADCEVAAVQEVNQKMNGQRNPVWWARSHSTGHSAGESTERYTLRLPADVRNRLLNQRFHRATSLVVLPRESSSRRGYRAAGDGGAARFSRRLSRGFRSDRWAFTMAPPFLVRASSVRSPKVASSAAAVEDSSSDAIMPPV